MKATSSHLHTLVLLVALLLTGCGNGGDAASTGGPLEGRDISRAGQLEGTWLGIDQGDFIGFEFMDDGKVLATPVTAALTGMGGGVMYDYSILEGGRLSLMTPNGQTRIFKVTIAGEQMELAGAMMLAPDDTQRFRRLPRGQTLEQGIEEQDRLDAEAYRKRYDALTAYLGRDDLVMAPTTPSPDAPPAIALALDLNGTGRAWHDDGPPHLDEIRAAIDTVDNDATRPAVRITFGPQVDPAPQQTRGGGQVVFNSSGEADEPRLIASVNYGNRPFELEIRRDAGLHRDIVGRFDAEKARIQALREPILSALKDYAVIEGRSGAQTANMATTDRIVLVRDPNTGKFSGEGTLTYESRPQQSGPVSADVIVYGDEAMLVIDGNYRRYQLTLASADTGALGGAWFPTGQQNGWQTELSIAEAIDVKERERRAEAQRQGLRSLGAGAQYFGRAPILAEAWGVPQPFVVLTVTSDAGSTFAATASYPSIDLAVAMTGQIAEALTGPSLQLRMASHEFGPNASQARLAPTLVQRQLQGQVWSLALTEPGSAASLLEGGGTGMGAVSLEPINDAWKRRQADAVRQTLAAGADFHAWKWSQRQEPATLFKFKLDPASGALSAVAPEQSRSMGTWPGQTYAGELTEQDGLPKAVLTYALGSKPDRPRDNRMTWFAHAGPDGGILLIGNLSRSSTPLGSFEMVLAR